MNELLTAARKLVIAPKFSYRQVPTTGTPGAVTDNYVPYTVYNDQFIFLSGSLTTKVLDLNTMSWSERTPNRPAYWRDGGQFTETKNGVAYFAMGVESSSISSAIWRWTVSNGSFTNIAKYPNKSMFGFSSMRIGDKIWCWGGATADYQPGRTYDEFQVFDCASLTWEYVKGTGAPPKDEMRCPSVFAIGDELYYSFIWANPRNLTTWKFNTKTLTWSQLGNIPRSITLQSQGTLIGDRFFIMGGLTLPGSENKPMLMEYSVSKDQWYDHGEYLDIGVSQGPIVFQWNGKAYIYSGYNGSGRSTKLWEITPL